MSNFSALKTAISNAIKQNGNEEITGNILQNILISVVETLGDSAINTLEIDLSNEAANRGDADTQLNNLITGIKNNIDNGYVYAGIATPSITPVSGKVFYISTAAGTYTNFGGLTVTQGITILKYNGSTWSQELVVGIDDIPTVGSNAMVKSNGIAQALKNVNNAIIKDDILMGAFCKVVTPMIEMTAGYYIPTDNVGVGDILDLTPQSASSQTGYAILNCAENDVFAVYSSYNALAGGGARLYCFLNNNNRVLAVAPDRININVGSLTTFTAPAGSVKVVLHKIGTVEIYKVNKKRTIDKKILVLDNPFIDETHFKVPANMLFVRNNEMTYIAIANRDEEIEITENCYLVFNYDTKAVRAIYTNTDCGVNDEFIVWNRNKQWISDISSYISPGFKSLHIFDTYISFDAVFTYNSVSLSQCRGITGSNVSVHNINVDGVVTRQTFVFTESGYLAYNSVTKTAEFKTDYHLLDANDYIWIYYKNGKVVGGLLYQSYIDTIQRKQQEEGITTLKRAQQFVSINWNAKSTVPTASNPTGISAGDHSGIPYTSCMEVDKFVGFDVSIKTFMTAANNPYSLFYTEYLKTDENHPNGISAYGFTYHGTRETIGGYMGIVCNVFGMYSIGYPIPYDTGNWKYLAKKGIFKKKSAQKAEYFQIGDIIIEPGHCNVITDVLYKGNSIESVEWSESKPPFPIVNRYNVAQANSRLQTKNGIIYRLSVPIDYYEKSEFVAVFDEVLSGAYSYNNDICTFAGDYAVFREGQKIFLNYNLDTVGGWTGIQLYKDDVLIDTLTIDTSVHRIDLTGLNLGYGDYKARMTDGSNYSDYTYFQIIQTEVSVTYNEDGTMTVDFSSANGTPLFLRLCKIDGGPIGILSLTEDEVRAESVTFNPQDLQQGYSLVHNGTYLKVYFASEYGRVTNEPILTNL